jgi:hypothetical protein
MTLPELIEAVEKMELTHSQLDLAIFRYLHPEFDGYVEGRGGLVHPSDSTDQRELSDVRWSPYTSSVESAMRLAIAKFDDGAIDIEVAYRTVGGIPHGRAEICGPRAFAMAKAKTPALALVLATLKALNFKEPRP